MASAPPENAAPDTRDPDSTPAEGKQYERQKLTRGIASGCLSLAVLIVAAFFIGPALDAALRPWVGDNRWLGLVALAFVYAAGLEVLTLPLDFWSGYVLEHRYHLSNQTAPRWLWRKVKSWLVGG